MPKGKTIDTTLVREGLSKILETPHFKSSKILANFLRFVVNETLNGNEQSLKEYVIATQVLKREVDFNPQLDAIVRIHARRLRRLLEEYYITEGIDDPIKISVPVGRYIPVFENKHINNVSSLPTDQEGLVYNQNLPKVAIIPSTKTGSNERLDVICTSFCRDLSIELSKFHELSIISNYSVQLAQNHLEGMGEIISKLQPDYLIIVTCFVIDDDFNSTIELHSVKKNQLIWADTYKIKKYVQNALGNYREIIRKVLSNISGFIGVIYQDLLSDLSIPNDYDYMYAIYWHNKYHSQFSAEAASQAYAAIEAGLDKNPNNSLLNSIKAELLLDSRMVETYKEADLLNEGMNLALKAVSLDRRNQHGWLMISWAFIMKPNQKKSVESLERCFSINPNNAMYHGSLGFAFVCIGEYDRGWELLSLAVQSPYYFWVANPGLCLYHLRDQNFEEAYYWARLIKRPGLVWDPLLRLCCEGHLKRISQMQQTKAEFVELHGPSVNADLLQVFIADENLVEILRTGLEKTGIEIVS